MGVMDEQLDAAAKAELDEHGMTIIEDLLTPEQVLVRTPPGSREYIIPT